MLSIVVGVLVGAVVLGAAAFARKRRVGEKNAALHKGVGVARKARIVEEGGAGVSIQRAGSGGAMVQPKRAYSAEQEEAPGSDVNLTTNSVTEQLPPGWKAAYDPATKKTYYFNPSNGESTWTKPRGGGGIAAGIARVTRQKQDIVGQTNQKYLI